MFVVFLFGFTYCCITSTFHRADIQQLFVNRMDHILLLTVLLNESLNIFLYVCPPHIDTLGMFSFIIESLCRHMINENGRKRYMINVPPIQGSKPPALQHLLLQCLCTLSETHFACEAVCVKIFFSTENPLPPLQFLAYSSI